MSECLCAACFNSKHFIDIINKYGDSDSENECSFDKTHKNKITISMKLFAKFVDEYFREHYTHGDEYISGFNDHDNAIRSNHGEQLEFLVRELLECDDIVLKAVINQLEKLDPYDPRDGDIPFYDAWTNYKAITDIEKRRNTDEKEYYEWQEYLEKTEIFDNLREQISHIQTLLQLNIDNYEAQRFHLMMIFSFVVSTFENFLSDRFQKSILSNVNDNNLKKKYLSATDNKTKINLVDIFDRHQNIDQFIIDSIKNTLFHNLRTANNLYNKVFNINFGDITKLETYIIKRHDFIHRCGKDKNDKDIETTKAEINNFISEVLSLCERIDDKL